MNTYVQDTYKSSLLSSIQHGHLIALKPVISAGTMSEVGNIKDIGTCVNEGNIASNNSFEVKERSGPVASMGNTTNVKVSALNTGRIGSGNTYEAGKLTADASVGNTVNVCAAKNQGSISSGNRHIIG